MDERLEMYELDEESYAYEVAVKEAEIEAERIRIVTTPPPLLLLPALFLSLS